MTVKIILVLSDKQADLVLQFLLRAVFPQPSHIERQQEEYTNEIYEPLCEKNLSLGSGLTQTRLYNHRRWLETRNFGLREKRYCTVFTY